MPSNVSEDLFGVTSFGYVVIESNRLDDWRRFGVEGLGLHLAHDDRAGLAFRMDAHARRMIVQKGTAEDVVAVGWQVRDDAALEVVLERLRARGIQIEEAGGDVAELRGVRQLWRFKGPKGLAIELFFEPLTTDEPLKMLTSGFVTDDNGMGHMAITSQRPESMQRFWQEIFDGRVSDYVEERIAGLMVDITFLRFNERHHTVAIAATRGVRMDPLRTKVQHINIEAKSFEDVSSAYRRLRDLGYEMAHEIGQHPNDKELSFYVLCPSGFEIELGWNALAVDESVWQTASYDRISTWGHKPEKGGLLHFVRLNAGNLFRGARSLLRQEYSPISEESRP
ncbi:MAG: VOC family protein [Deltaproteobacteria bacterium]|nr:VOC family protein [Deltaproteobacteria bacterium]NND29848.1 extradiol ring-cleavage dioxygenase [Myxococcales bacterium]MBT8466952.1 VOC family protein [Deltaproteobacteria bacterium]MBT8482999.1 VOC family protein [Deltaproteobacteria bacterium]NNK07700.1 extradiol ring-cleavage dioxygenase [Myxococcales bacterium]